MTPAQAALLRKLRDEGPQRATEDHESVSLFLYDEGFIWLEWPDIWMDHITPAGIAALEAYERGKGDGLCR